MVNQSAPDWLALQGATDLCLTSIQWDRIETARFFYQNGSLGASASGAADEGEWEL